MYYFTTLALTLNEPEEGVAPTDSRLRPDQRLMEAGRWDEANAEKQRLEEKQRTARREREREATSHRTFSQTEEGESRSCSTVMITASLGSIFIIRALKKSLWSPFFLPKAVDEDALTDPSLKSKYLSCFLIHTTSRFCPSRSFQIIFVNVTVVMPNVRQRIYLLNTI